LVAFAESSTISADFTLREPTRAITTTLPNSVTWLLGSSPSARGAAALSPGPAPKVPAQAIEDQLRISGLLL
jgi:hypothetical protein